MKFIQTYFENCLSDYISIENIERFTLHSWNHLAEEGHECITVQAVEEDQLDINGWTVSLSFNDWDKARYFMNKLIQKINEGEN